MSRPNPIQYAERLYAAIRAANFSPISFLAFGNAVKEGVELRRMPRIAAEPFMRVVGEMLSLEYESAGRTALDVQVDTELESRTPLKSQAGGQFSFENPSAAGKTTADRDEEPTTSESPDSKAPGEGD